MRSVILAIWLLSITKYTQGQQPVEIRDSIDQHIFSFGEIEFLEDPSGKLNVYQVASGEYSSRFKPSITYSPTNTHRESVYWYRIKVKHPLQSSKHWVIEFFDQTIDHLEFNVPLDFGNYETMVMGDELDFRNRESKHKNFIVHLSNRGGEESTYYVRVKSQQKADVLIVLRSQNWLFEYALDEYFFFGIFYGMIMVFSFYNLLMFIAVRERHYLYYIIYLVSVGLYEMSADGIGFQYLWPKVAWFNYYAPSIFLYLASATALIFSASVLNFRKGNKFFFTLFTVVFLFRTVFLGLSLTVAPQWVTFRFIEILPFVTIYFGSIWSFLYQKYSPSRFLVMAYSFLAFGILYKILQHYNIQWSPLGSLSHYSLGFSFVFEMLLLSFAISDKIRLLRLEKAEAQARTIEQLNENQKLKDNLNKTLEEQVKLKTEELLKKSEFIENQNQQLEKVNHQLEAQAKEIEEINKLLERENVQLHHDVEEVKEARMLSKEVSFEEFSAMHPNEESWMRFLSDIKWPNNFICKKCQHESFSPGRGAFSRRCTKCGYDESVTTNTLVQNTRLPIAKALYMIFLVYNSQGAISSHKLSEILGIRQSTCWLYSARIKSALKEKQKKGMRYQQKGWSSIILAD